MKKTLALCLVLLSGLLAVADHLPANLLALGKPENTLAGINLEHDTPAEVLRRLGPPTKKVTAPNNPQWTGYLWESATTRLEVEVSKGKERDYLNRITLVRLGDSLSTYTGAVESTGRGLELGDTLERLKSFYGSRYRLRKQAQVPVHAEPFQSVPGSETAVVQWAQMEFTLTAGLDGRGRIVALQLSPPECYPGGCQ